MEADKQDHNIAVQIAKNFDNIDFHTLKLRKLVTSVCSRFGLTKATVSIAIVGNAEISRVNKQFFNRSDATDVISFDLSDDNDKKSFELVVNGEMAVKEANLRSHTPQAELALYITHGLLHNLGFDDSTEKLAGKMHETEDEILQQSGYGSVYNQA